MPATSRTRKHIRPMLPCAGAIVLLLLACGGGRSDESIWAERLGEPVEKHQPKDVDLLSVQVSKLPSDAFGHGVPPWRKHGFVSSWVVGSGTGLYGTFKLDDDSTLVLQEDASSLVRFVDDQGRDLLAVPDTDPPNTFFDSNKTLQVETIPEKQLAVFTLRGYEVPTPGATTLEAEARMVFLSLSEEQTAEQEDVTFQSGARLEAGPVALTIYAKANLPAKQKRLSTKRWTYAVPVDQADWVLVIEPREKPLKSIEFVDADGQVVVSTSGPSFEGRAYWYYLKDQGIKSATMRITWYEKSELIAIPLKISTPLGI